MKFSVFLKAYKQRRKINNSTDLYKFFGGKRALGISLRHFQDIESGKQPPPEKLLLVAFANTFDSEKTDCIISFFNSKLDNLPKSELIRFLENHLKIPIPEEKRVFWEKKESEYKDYTKEQLSFLSENEEALRLHKRLLLFEEESIPMSQVRLDADSITKLLELDLIRIDNNKIKINHSYCRVPKQESSSKAVTVKATEYILNHIETFISKEGSPDQGLFYATQIMSKQDAQRAIQQQNAFKNELHNLATEHYDENCTPFVFVSFCKQLTNRDLGIYV